MKKFFSIFFTCIFAGAFIFSAYQMYRIMDDYSEGEAEIAEIQNTSTSERIIPKEDDGPAVTASIEEPNYPYDIFIDFDELKRKNSDTIGWIRFAPEPAAINYPIVQTTDNETYLNFTFTKRASKMGAIFMETLNSSDFSDQNTVIYGHRMKNKTMFYHLEDYKKKEFWEQYPYFYIYTPDGMVSTYLIFNCATINSESPSYNCNYGGEKEFNSMIKSIKNAGYYDTGIDVTYGSKIITLSTCTAASDDNRITVRGVLIDTNPAY